MKRFAFSLLCLFSIFHTEEPLFAEGSVAAILDRSEISMEETATLILSLKIAKGNEEVPLPVIPRVPGLSIFYRETRQVLSPQGGTLSPSREFVYTLSPETEGTKTIPSIGIHVGGELLLTKPLTLHVAPVSGPSRRPASAEGDRGLESRVTLEGEVPKAFTRMVVDNLKPFLYEPVKVTLWAYATVPFQYQGLKSEPNNPGFTRMKEVTRKFIPQEDTETVEGETYLGKSLEEQIWFPNQSGSLPFGLGEMTLALKTKAKNLFDRSFQDERPAGHFGSHAESQVLKVDPIVLEVRPLPEENKPPDFSGAVGNFTVFASIDKTDLQIGDSATLKFQIRGKGNLKQMKNPAFEKFSFATSFDPRASEKINSEKSPFEIEKNYEIILITNRVGNFSISPISFIYFNPKFHKYRKITTDPIAIAIQEKEKAPAVVPEESRKAEPELIGKDIYYLKKVGPLRSEPLSFVKAPLFWVFQAIPLLLFFFALSWRSYQLYLIRNAGVLRKRRAFQTSQLRLKKAEHHLSQRRIQDFAQEAGEAILGYFSDKTGLPKGGLTLDKMDALLTGAGGDEAIRESLKECLETLQAFQFAATERTDKDPRVSYELSKSLLQKLDRMEL